MAKWSEIAADSLAAAKELLPAARFRSGVSRAYYAAYARATAELERLTAFPPGREGPSHDDLPDMVFDYLTRLSSHDRWLYSVIVGQLYVRRIAADYQPSQTVDEQIARESIVWAERFLNAMEAAYG